MQEITHKGGHRKDYTLRFDVRQYVNDPIYAPISMFQRVISHKDDTNPVQIDSARLMACFQNLRAKDFKYYFFLLNKLERNDIAIVAPHKEIRLYFGEHGINVVASALQRLVQQGLVFPAPNTRANYIINPMYAWKGNRLDYLDLSTFEDHT